MESKSSSNQNASKLIGTGKDLVTLLRDSLLFVIALLLLFFPNKLNDVLVKAGFEEGSVVGFKWKAGLAKSDLALREAQVTITNLKTQLDSMSMVLNQAQSKVNDPVFKERISKLEEENKQVNIASSKTQASVRSTISSNASLVKNAQQAVNQNSKWGVVFSGDATLEGATYELRTAAPKFGIPNVSIYYRQGSYRSVSVVDDREAAEQVLEIAKKKRRADSYIVPMSTWCPNFNEKDGYYECK